MKRIFRKPNIPKIIFALYLIIVWSAFIIEHYYNWKIYDNAKGIVIKLILITTLAVIPLVNALFKWVNSITITQPQLSTKQKIISILVIAVLTFVYYYLWYKAFYPGAFSYDSIYQLSQALEGSYNDWHPVWQTIFTFKIPLILFKDTSCIILCQIIFATISVTFLIYTVFEYGGYKLTYISILCIFLNPAIGTTTMYPWKDVAFAYMSAIAFTLVTRIYLSCYNNKKHNIILLIFLGLVLGNATLFRHNGILFTVALLLSLLLIIPSRKWAIVCLTMLSFIAVINVPVYNSLNVTKSETPNIELLGLPLTVIGNVVKEDSECLDEEMQEYIYSIASQDDWERAYIRGNGNSVKNDSAFNIGIINAKSPLYTLKICLKCFCYSPIESLKALFSLTDIVYGTEQFKDYVWPTIYTNNYDITYNGNTDIKNFFEAYTGFITNTIFKYINILGISICTMLLFILGRRSIIGHYWTKLAICSSIFIYDFGTMLLLTGWDNRFFFITYFIFPLVILIMLHPEVSDIKTRIQTA